MFGFRRRETPPLQIYGKLPLAKDYLRLGFGEDVGITARDWVDAVFSGGGGRRAPKTAWPLRFLIGEAWQGSMQGLMFPSSDAGGLRPFPFLLAVARQERALVDDLEGGMPIAGSIWQLLHDRWQAVSSFQDGRGLLAAWRGNEIDVAGAAASPPAAVALDAWLAALWPGAGRAGLEADLDRLARLPADEPVRLPLAWGGSVRQQVVAWLELLGRLGLSGGRSVPTMFLPAVNAPPPQAEEPAGTVPLGPAALVVFRSGPRVEHGAWLDASGEGPRGAGDLAAGRPVVTLDAAPVAEGAPSLAASLRASVTNYLRRRGGQP